MDFCQVGEVIHKLICLAIAVSGPPVYMKIEENQGLG